jgi:hypothetical protein
MYRITSTGKNPNYGKEGQRKDISNWHYERCKEKGWYHHGKFNGHGRMVIRVIKS